ncbi:MAG TPA: HigA family addiction module antitoxin [Actinomycetes bacterium]|nr:HigA family addiction module antitoxin [Actinomycetes bacterium]
MTINHTPEAFPPGEFLRDELEEREWTVTEFAEILGRPVQAISEILNNKKEITTETAVAIGDALGTSAELWLNLQTAYRLNEQRRQRGGVVVSPVARRARLRDVAPIAKMKARGWLPQTDDLDELESAVCALLDVRSLDEPPLFAVAARRADTEEPISLEQTAWLARVRVLGRDAEVAAAFDADAFAALAASVPRLLANGPDDLKELPARFAACGVALVFVGDRPVIGLSARGDRFDSLVFTLLHECAHLVLRHITPSTPVIVDDNLDEAQQSPIEIQANEQAARWMFPDGFDVVALRVPAVISAASRHGVHVSLVIGRLQRDLNDWKKLRSEIPRVRTHLTDAGLLS